MKILSMSLKRVLEAIEEYNRYRAPEAKARAYFI